MSDGRKLNVSSNLVSFDRYSGYDINMSYCPYLWIRDWPTYVAMVFPHPDPQSYIKSLPKLPILESASYYGLEVEGVLEVVVALLFDGLLEYHVQTWHIVNPHYPRHWIPIPDYSDIFLAESKVVSPDSALACLSQLLEQEPPSILLKPQEP
ncbi:MAG: hypothetical protein NVSMB39_3380 [Candidatus Saccharimonadales bacterium]